LVAVYDWHVAEDRVVGDTGLADLFSMPAGQVAGGLPIADFLKAIHPDDVPLVEASIADAVEKRSSFSTSYRVRDGRSWRRVTALGKCFKSEVGELRFSGVVVAEEADESEPTINLPPRELQCLSWCSQGKTNWEIGKILGISERTVEHHVASAVRRLGCTGRVQGVALALRLGLIK